MSIPPISKGPRITREEAIISLVGLSFTKEEAEQFLDEYDQEKRKAITQAVIKRVKEGK